MNERELQDLRRLAAREHLTVAAWSRRALREAARREPTVAASKKLAHIRNAFRHSFPTADIGQMLAEIEQGYGSGPVS